MKIYFGILLSAATSVDMISSFVQDNSPQKEMIKTYRRHLMWREDQRVREHIQRIDTELNVLRLRGVAIPSYAVDMETTMIMDEDDGTLTPKHERTADEQRAAELVQERGDLLYSAHTLDFRPSSFDDVRLARIYCRRVMAHVANFFHLVVQHFDNDDGPCVWGVHVSDIDPSQFTTPLALSATSAMHDAIMAVPVLRRRHVAPQFVLFP